MTHGMDRARTRSRLLAGVLVVALLLALLFFFDSRSSGPPPLPARSGLAEWTAYGGDALGSRYSHLTEITPANVTALRVAWTFRTGETPEAHPTAEPTAFEATPIVLDGTLHLSTPLGRVLALDPHTGEERWRYDARVDPLVEFGDFTSRGVSAWSDESLPAGSPCRRRIFVATIDARLIALDATHGRPCPAFGSAGTVDLRRDLRNPPVETAEYEVTSPPAVIGELVVVGSAVADNNRMDAVSGEVRAFDARTGELRWTWDPVPRDSTDLGWATWVGPRAHATGAANAWSVIAADAERDLVFVPTGSASPDYFGGERRGANLYANSLVALRASTGKRVWHFQVVHHDLWDYDVAAPPALVTLRRDGHAVPAVLVATKTGQLFVLHRETGRPLFPVRERPVPTRAVPGEEPWPTQPFSSLPALSPQTFTAEDAWGLTPFDRRACRRSMARMRHEGPFTPPSFEGSIVTPHNVGGAHWGGVAYDPVRQIAVVPVNRFPAYVQLLPRGQFDPEEAEDSDFEYAMMRGTPYVLRRGKILSPLGLPCTAPPWGSLVAISLRTGRKLWDVPLGTTRDMASFLGIPLPFRTGTPNLGGPIVTAGGLVFIAAAMDDYLRAFDIESGRELWKARLPAGAQATPMTYRLGRSSRQHVVIAAGGHGKLETTRGDHVIAFALPALSERRAR
ncbi:MAG: pyrroloquinoline quinone-dependent dehydrogenase [Gemmatimonadetes bacterium]|nr:pyrroloquinoline quinone-dependent dehydrogenase [Gemmatimonadota bacterium]